MCACQPPAKDQHARCVSVLICVMRHSAFFYDVTGDRWAIGPGLECSQVGFTIAAVKSLAVIWI